ncbi:PilC/PilY family type IV pilus protein [Snodgrassella gandavensis]|uniref:PilC/PilY family type IV pilus protein n=1 Tax=Snodgrassella gandavensis TaxID=2946698 RepID=UPI001EF5C6F6|nr:PilC/PilY family type IV pilus protein [Snodgrassella gandavensis]
MRHKFVKNKKGKFLKGQKILFSAVTAALSAFPVLPALAEVNIFADIPLHLQSSSTTTKAYSVKPNVTFFIDDSASMREKIKGQQTYKCRHRTSIRKNANGRTVAWSPLSEYQYGYASKPINNNDIRYYCRPYKKIDGVKDVLLNIVENHHDNMYFAFHPLHSGGVDPRYNTFYDASNPEEYGTLTDLIKNMPTHGTTPTTRQFPTLARNLVMNKLQYRCQKSYIILLSDGEAKRFYYAKAPDDGYFDFDEKMRNSDERRKFFRDEDQYTPYRLQYYTKTLNEKSFGSYIYAGNYYNDNASDVINVPKRPTDKAGKAWDSPDPLNDNRPFTQTAETFTIGAGLGEKNSKLGKLAIPYLENGAQPGPNAGHFFNTNSQEEIEEAFKKIFESIKGSVETSTTNTTATAPTVAVSRSEQSNLSITAMIESGSWSTKLCIRPIEDETTDKTNNKCVEPSFNNRRLLLNDGTQTYMYSGSLAGLNNNTFKISNNGKNQSEWLNGLLTWLSRSKPDAAIKTDDFVLDYRQRGTSPISEFGETRNMGDIINNPIITAGNKDEESGLQKYMITSANDGMVYVFRATNDKTHFYDLKFNFMPMGIERQSNDGSDLVAHYYKYLTDNDYGKNSKHPHRFLLNGGMVAQQTEQSNDSHGRPRPQQTFMLSTMGQAGRGAFAINIGGKDLVSHYPVAVDNIGSSGWYDDVALFQTPTGSNNYFGFTVGTPAIARLRVNEERGASATSVANHIREAAFIGNGYNYSSTLASNDAGSQSSESALYIYDILGVDVGTDGYRETGFRKGELIAKLALEPELNSSDKDESEETDDSNKYTGGLSGPTVIDINGDGVADVAYAGDYGGNLYRFDLRSPDPENWTVHKIFSAGKPITSAPGVTMVKKTQNNNSNNNGPLSNWDVIITFGTGSDIYQSDLTSKEQQTVYGIYDDLINPRPPEISKSTLLQQELTVSGGYRQLSEKRFNPRQHNGWYFNLESGTGERVVTKPITITHAGVVFARKYEVKKDDDLVDPCEATERKQESKVYSSVIQYNIKTGARLKDTDPHFVFENIPFGAVLTLEGLYSATTSDGSNLLGTGVSPYDIGGDGTQSPLEESDQPPKACTRASMEAIGTDGKKIPIVNVPKCPIRFKRLSWREVQTDYIS